MLGGGPTRRRRIAWSNAEHPTHQGCTKPMMPRRKGLLCGLTLSFVRGMHATVRLFVPPQPLAASQLISVVGTQRHYLANVMRVRQGAEVLVFNGRDGEWLAAVDAIDKRRCELRVVRCTRPQPAPAPAPVLLFAVLKSARLPTLVEKACELGVGELRPVLTERCAARKLNVPRLQAIAVEAAEQSRRLTVPEIREPLSLQRALDMWGGDRPLYLCDERGGAPPLSSKLAVVASAEEAARADGPGPGVLIGPEGGFSPEEFEALAKAPAVEPVSLGPNTLRAETAALAACAVLACR